MVSKLRITYLQLLLFSLFCIALLAVRVLIFHNVNYFFLIWNLFLAWIPFQIALFASNVSSFHPKKFSFFLILILLAWLAFFPNAPYIVTDFMHLHFASIPGRWGESSSPFAFWVQAILFFFFSVAGFLYALCSLQLVEKIFRKMLGRFLSTVTLLVIFLLTGFGIYIGRFLRWNSWDIVFDPFSLFRDISANITLEGIAFPFIVTFFFSLLLGLCYFFFNLGVEFRQSSSSKISQPDVPTFGHSQK